MTEELEYDEMLEFFESTGMSTSRAEGLIQALHDAGLMVVRKGTPPT